MYPTWDLIYISLFIVSVAYGVIIGPSRTWKIVFSTYVFILVADAIGRLASRMLSEDLALRLFSLGSSEELVAVIKIFVFATGVVFFTKVGKFKITTGMGQSAFMKLGMSLSIAILSAGLIIATITTYLLGNSLFDSAGGLSQTGAFIQDQSVLVNVMVQNYGTIFALPAIAFIVTSLFWGEE